MASTAKKWGIGCGIGCGFVLLVLGGIGTCGYVGVKKVVDRVETMEGTFEEMDASFGRPGEFTPAVDGTIDADRMETFVEVREALTPDRDEATEILALLDEDGSGPANTFAKIKAGMRFIPSMFDYIDRRNEVLLERGMGLGEYQYLYALSYFGHLGKLPSDGPDFQINSGQDADHEAGPVRWGVHTEGSDDEDVRAERDREVRKTLNGTLRQIAENQLRALEEQLLLNDDPDLRLWRDELAAEMETMDREPRRILWEEGLPARLADSIEPYSDRLEATYGELINVVEMGLVNHD